MAGGVDETGAEAATIAPAAPAEHAEVLALVSASGLPLAGLEQHLDTALVARAEGRVAGCVAVELYGEDALLRSLAVAAGWRGRRLGERLTRAALALARGRGAERVWLLTTTADRFFPRFGFARVERDALPAALGPSAELRGACPATAVAMRLELGG